MDIKVLNIESNKSQNLKISGLISLISLGIEDNFMNIVLSP